MNDNIDRPWNVRTSSAAPNGTILSFGCAGSWAQRSPGPTQSWKKQRAETIIDCNSYCPTYREIAKVYHSLDIMFHLCFFSHRMRLRSSAVPQCSLTLYSIPAIYVYYIASKWSGTWQRKKRRAKPIAEDKSNSVNGLESRRPSQATKNKRTRTVYRNKSQSACESIAPNAENGKCTNNRKSKTAQLK